MLKLVDLKPVIIALSCQIDEHTLKRTSEVGFHSAFLQPLTVERLKEEILPIVSVR